MARLPSMAAGSPAAAEEVDRFRADLRKLYRVSCGSEAPELATRLRLWATHYGLHCVAVYRFGRLARALAARHRWASPLAFGAGVLGHAVELVHHVRVYADVGPGFYIGHAGTIFIGPTTIGRNFSVTHNVTIGLGQSEGATGYPVIGDDVWVGTGCVVSGAIRVGDGATVAHGTMLSRSVPPRALAVGNPGRVVLQGYDNAALLGSAARRAAGGS